MADSFKPLWSFFLAKDRENFWGVSEMTVFGYGRAMMEKARGWQEKRREKFKGIVGIG